MTTKREMRVKITYNEGINKENSKQFETLTDLFSGRFIRREKMFKGVQHSLYETCRHPARYLTLSGIRRMAHTTFSQETIILY